MNSSSTPQLAATIPAPGGVDGRSSRWQSHRTARRAELIRSARRAVHRLGQGASMEEMAAAAGTSKSVFYRYFGDKAGLQRAMGEVVIGQMQERLVAAARTATTPRAGLHAMVTEYLQMAQTSPNVYSFVTRVGVENTAPARLGDFFATITAMMEEPMLSYVGARAAPGQMYWPAAAIGFVRAAGEQWLAGADGPDKPELPLMADQLTNWLIAGIDPATAPQR